MRPHTSPGTSARLIAPQRSGVERWTRLPDRAFPKTRDAKTLLRKSETVAAARAATGGHRFCSSNLSNGPYFRPSRILRVRNDSLVRIRALALSGNGFNHVDRDCGVLTHARVCMVGKWNTRIVTWHRRLDAGRATGLEPVTRTPAPRPP